MHIVYIWKKKIKWSLSVSCTFSALRLIAPLWVLPLQELPAGASVPDLSSSSQEEHERRISHSMYPGLDGLEDLDDTLTSRPSMMGRMMGESS